MGGRMVTSDFQNALIFSGLAAGADMVGGAVMTVRCGWNARVFGGTLALGSGFMLAAVLLDIIPAGLAGGSPRLPGLVLAGYLLVQVAERVLGPHVHDERGHHHAHDELQINARVSLAALAGFMLHTFFDGVSIGAGFAVSSSLGLLVFLAVLLHKVPEGITLACIVLAGGGSRRQALGAAVLIGAATVVGALLTGTLASRFNTPALAVAGGVML